MKRKYIYAICEKAIDLIELLKISFPSQPLVSHYRAIIKKPVILFLFFIGFSTAASAQQSELERLNNEAKLLFQKGQYDKAAIAAKRALAVAETSASPGHPAVAQSLNDLADVYFAQGEYKQAESLYKRALAIREEALAPIIAMWQIA
jgi:tetratricopeptide (TPR) repeat protein